MLLKHPGEGHSSAPVKEQIVPINKEWKVLLLPLFFFPAGSRGGGCTWLGEHRNTRAVWEGLGHREERMDGVRKSNNSNPECARAGGRAPAGVPGANNSRWEWALDRAGAELSSSRAGGVGLQEEEAPNKPRRRRKEGEGR